MQQDMFDNSGKHQLPPRVLSEKQKLERLRLEHQKYIKSSLWQKNRELLLRLKGRKCERCGKENHLQVHHLHYKTLGQEQVSDVEIVCRHCHEMADAERKQREARKSVARVEDAIFENGFRTWLQKRFGNCADLYLNDFGERKCYIEWLESKESDQY